MQKVSTWKDQSGDYFLEELLLEGAEGKDKNNAVNGTGITNVPVNTM